MFSVLRMGKFERMGTYNIPKPRMPPTENFSLRASLTFQRRGMGLARSMSAHISFRWENEREAKQAYNTAVTQSVTMLTAVVT